MNVYMQIIHYCFFNYLPDVDVNRCEVDDPVKLERIAFAEDAPPASLVPPPIALPRKL